MAARKKLQKVMLDIEGGYKHTLSVNAPFKSGDILAEADSPHSWITIPTASGGEFSIRAGMVVSIHVEDAEVVGARAA